MRDCPNGCQCPACGAVEAAELVVNMREVPVFTGPTLHGG